MVLNILNLLVRHLEKELTPEQREFLNVIIRK